MPFPADWPAENARARVALWRRFDRSSESALRNVPLFRSAPEDLPRALGEMLENDGTLVQLITNVPFRRGNAVVALGDEVTATLRRDSNALSCACMHKIHDQGVCFVNLAREGETTTRMLERTSVLGSYPQGWCCACRACATLGAPWVGLRWS